MAGADYKSCDKCGCKTFYDSNLDYNDEWDKNWERPYGVGDWKVLCKRCSESHKVLIIKRDSDGF